MTLPAHADPAADQLGGDRQDRLLAAVGSRLDEAVIVVEATSRRLRFANPAAVGLLRLGDVIPGTRLEDAVRDYRLALMVGACVAAGEEVVRELADPALGRHVVARAVPVPPEVPGGSSDVAIVLRDESRLRRLETVRRDFVANVSHELRTPIAAIQLLVETLQGGALEDADVAGEFVAKIGLEVGHMAQIVSELLELSAIESGRRPLRRDPVGVDSLFDAAGRLRPLADERRISMRFEGADDTLAVVGDAAALAQVVRNLVHNAIKFTPPGGVIAVRARVASSSGDGGGGDRDLVELQVVDTGCGIPEEEVARIFERFYKADKSRQRDGEGTGLGLAIARHTVELHGGTIGVESEPGQGSTFTVRLPRTAVDAGR
ncbi:MAG TPA: ATP-binding protein [Candidatus Dormibacteraeota bacterium]|nr:ATP-binding protein [Candidatus Dormibacteraeota bacterium]